jgi:hypothetical protein
VLAENAYLSREYVNKIEAGRYDLPLSTINALAKALGVKLGGYWNEPRQQDEGELPHCHRDRGGVDCWGRAAVESRGLAVAGFGQVCRGRCFRQRCGCMENRFKYRGNEPVLCVIGADDCLPKALASRRPARLTPRRRRLRENDAPIELVAGEAMGAFEHQHTLVYAHPSTAKRTRDLTKHLEGA